MGGKRKRSGAASEPRGAKKKTAAGVVPLPTPEDARGASSPQVAAAQAVEPDPVAGGVVSEEAAVEPGDPMSAPGEKLADTEWFEAATAQTLEDDAPRRDPVVEGPVPMLAGTPIGASVSDPGPKGEVDAAPRAELVAAAARVIPLIARPRPARRHRRPTPTGAPKWLEVVSGEVEVERVLRPEVATEAPRVEVSRYALDPSVTTEVPAAPLQRVPHAVKEVRSEPRAASASTGAALRGAKPKAKGRGPGAFFLTSLAAAGAIVAVGLQGGSEESRPERGRAIGASRPTRAPESEAAAPGASTASGAGASTASGPGASTASGAVAVATPPSLGGAQSGRESAASRPREVGEGLRDEVGTIPVVRVSASAPVAAPPNVVGSGDLVELGDVAEAGRVAEPERIAAPESGAKVEVTQPAGGVVNAGPGDVKVAASANDGKPASEANSEAIQEPRVNAPEGNVNVEPQRPRPVEVTQRPAARVQVERAVAFTEPSQPDPYPHVPPAAWAESATIASQLEAARRYEGLPPRGFIDLSADPAQSGPVPGRVKGKTFYDTVPPLGGAEQRVVLLKRVEPVPSEPADPPAGKTADKVAATPRFYFQSEPSGAEVYIDGRRRGRTPLAVDLEPRPGEVTWPAVEVLLVHPEFLPETMRLAPQGSARLVRVPLRKSPR